MQVFHSAFLVDAAGNHPEPMTSVSLQDVESGRWKVNPRVSEELGVDQGYLIHYCRSLSRDGLYSLIVWPYHAMSGGIGHALVSAVEEALFFHNIVRGSQTRFEVKGAHPLTENYSVLRPEVLDDAAGNELAGLNRELVDELLGYDALIVAGQAKNHCVAWTVADLLAEIRKRDEALADKVYLLEDCSSPIVVPGAADFTEQNSFGTKPKARLEQILNRNLGFALTAFRSQHAEYVRLLELHLGRVLDRDQTLVVFNFL